MIITLMGDAGSGKSTVGKILAQKLGYKYIQMGEITSEIAREKGVTQIELAQIAKNDGGEVDRLIDEKQKNLGKTQDNIIVDGRLSWYFLPQSVKIFLKVNIDEAARRIYEEQRNDEQENTSLEETKRHMITRRESERERYKKYYGIEDFENLSHYDIILDTTHLTVGEVIEAIIQELPKE